MSKVPLAYHGRLIARLVEGVREGPLLTVVDGVIKGLDSVGVTVHTSEHGRSSWGANCIGSKAIVKTHSLVCYSV